jgi:hypothetical protein
MSTFGLRRIRLYAPSRDFGEVRVSAQTAVDTEGWGTPLKLFVKVRMRCGEGLSLFSLSAAKQTAANGII